MVAINFVVFFFQAEDGIRAGRVTGVQTCALPIFCPKVVGNRRARACASRLNSPTVARGRRSEERRVGRECRSRWSPYNSKKKRATMALAKRRRCSPSTGVGCSTTTSSGRTVNAVNPAIIGTGSMLIFFFQAEDGIRDGRVTGVQTCALPIYFVRVREHWSGTRLRVEVRDRN